MHGRTDYDHLALTARELERLEALERYGLEDGYTDDALDRITRLVTTALEVRSSAISVIGKETQWLMSTYGLTRCASPRCDSFCSHVVALDQHVGVPDARRDIRFAGNPLVTGHPDIRFYLGVPLRTAEGFVVGALCAVDDRTQEIQERHVEILTDLAALVMDRIELHLAAALDGLTGALRHNAFLSEAGRDFQRAARNGQALSCLMIDADHFKLVNDRFGHAKGDQVLALIGGVCKSFCRAGDYTGRVGGEEFCVMLPGVAAEGALAIAERLRVQIHAASLAAPDLPAVTVSIGVATLGSGDAAISDVMARADRALYAAKHAGRNRCRSA
ncbi:GGDEF domain-containing protein [Kaistia adipata]|uniref:GGDEF domain-containing protein n=1 Tax=Kaistia adipata TaxID=166954 RepID=UPI000400EEBF|nr:sensor domain-containing diguanylate cyclase [Kaistia adipata]